ncbi:hypothetical protein FQN54_002533 [Arachnomyces sp. PD_36]|nr:hypothetical protein FQN54_002533 [Arachnomyces sp. PD_36]
MSGSGDMSEAPAIEDGQATESLHPSLILKNYLLENVPVYPRLVELKEMGHNNPAADAHFELQRQRADNADSRTQDILFKMMIGLGDELHATTGAFQLGDSDDRNQALKVLDLCMAPGGFAVSILKHRPLAQVSGISLPKANGGHKMYVRHGNRDSRVTVQYLDITMLAADLFPTTHGDELPPILTTHPRAQDFILDTRPYFATQNKYDIAFCDGQVLRTHTPKLPHPNFEAIRLTCSQLVIALTRLKSGGTLIMLLHRPESWDIARLIQTVDSFSDGPVRLFKPAKKHASRSSFYLVAKGVQPDSPKAKEAVDMWRRTWLTATLRSGTEYVEERLEEKQRGWSDWENPGNADEFIKEFGERLVDLATPVWEIQAEALAKAPYLKATDKGESGGTRS